MEVLILDPLVAIQGTISSKHRRVRHSYETTLDQVIQEDCQ